MKKSLLALALAAASFAAQAQNQAVISFTAPSGCTPTTCSYHVYQGVGVGGTKTRVGTITTTSATVTSGIQSPGRYCWEVTTALTADLTIESARSNEACKAFAPGTVTITVQ